MLTHELGQLTSAEELADSLRALRAPCRKFLDTIQPRQHLIEQHGFSQDHSHALQRRQIPQGGREEPAQRCGEDVLDGRIRELSRAARDYACALIQNRLGALLADPTLHRMLVEPEIDLHFRKLMDDGLVLLVNLSKGTLGEDSALVLGSLIVSAIGLAAFCRADAEPAERRPYFLYLDKFHNFTTLMLANMMGELRNAGLDLFSRISTCISWNRRSAMRCSAMPARSSPSALVPRTPRCWRRVSAESRGSRSS